MVKFWDIPMVTAGALASDFTAPKTPESEYYLLTRTGLSFDEVSLFLSKLFRKFNWSSVLVFYDSMARREIMKEHYCSLFAKALIDKLRLQSFSVYYNKIDLNLSDENEIKR
ncbi:atrial natriuretic peptide receptor 3-like protein, partial [Leptotrombidium deliense]